MSTTASLNHEAPVPSDERDRMMNEIDSLRNDNERLRKALVRISTGDLGIHHAMAVAKQALR